MNVININKRPVDPKLSHMVALYEVEQFRNQNIFYSIRVVKYQMALQ